MSNKQIHNIHQTPKKPDEKRKKQRKLILEWSYKIVKFIVRWILLDDFFND